MKDLKKFLLEIYDAIINPFKQESTIGFLFRTVSELGDKILSTKFELKTAIPAVSFCLVILGAYDTCYYYSLFGINIVPFLDPSELIFSFASLLPIFLFTFSFLIANFAPAYFIAKAFLTIKGFPIIPLIITAALLPVWYFGRYWAFDIFPIIWILEYKFSVVFYLLFVLGTPLILLVSKKRLTLLAKTIIILFLSAIYLTQEKIYFYNLILKDGKHRFNVRMTLSESAVNTNDCLFYVGTTRNYIFFWDDNSGESIVYPLADVKSLQVRDILKVGLTEKEYSP